MEKIVITAEDAMSVIMEGKRDAIIAVIEKSVEYARHLNFPDGTYVGSLCRGMHGSEFIHGMFESGIIDHDLYMQLCRLAEDMEMKYTIEI